MTSTRQLVFPAQKMLHPIFLSYCLCLIFAMADDVCNTPKYCTVMSWHPWGNCTGGCGKITFQTRHRYICFDDQKFAIPTREKVMNYCNFSLSYPMKETRPCSQCPYGIYNTTTNACVICKNIKCSDLPCKHGVCYDTTAGFRCDCESGYSGIDCSVELINLAPSNAAQQFNAAQTPYVCYLSRPDALFRLETPSYNDKIKIRNISKELELPTWLPKLEIALLAVISLTILMTMGCLCLRCCKLFGCLSSDDDDEEEERKAKRRKDPRPIPKSKTGKSFDF